MTLFPEFESFFDKMWNNFNRPVQDMKPYKVYENGGKGYILVVNTLGIEKKDISVTLKNEKGKFYPVLKVEGSTSIKKINFENSVNLGIALKLNYEDIAGIEYDVKDGLTIINLKIKEKQNTDLLAKPLGDSEDFDW